MRPWTCNEGSKADLDGRRWDVDILTPDEARQAIHDAQHNAKAGEKMKKLAAELESDRKEVVDIVRKLPAPETKSGIRDQASCGHKRFDRAFASLTRDGHLQQAGVKKANGQEYQGWSLRNEQEK